MRVQKSPPRRVVWGLVAVPEVGRMVVGVTERGAVCRVSFLRGREEVVEVVERWEREWSGTAFVAGRVAKRFWELPVVLVGEGFKVRVWKVIMKIPAGEVLSYGEVAVRAGAPGAARAVGTACGSNVVAWVVPCHRVVAARGLGGYGPAGLDFKRALLKAEGVILGQR